MCSRSFRGQPIRQTTQQIKPRKIWDRGDPYFADTVAMAKKDGVTLDEMLNVADQHMYAVKDARKRGVPLLSNPAGA